MFVLKQSHYNHCSLCRTLLKDGVAYKQQDRAYIRILPPLKVETVASISRCLSSQHESGAKAYTACQEISFSCRDV